MSTPDQNPARKLLRGNVALLAIFTVLGAILSASPLGLLSAEVKPLES